jgi:hypothetical protein
MRARLAALLLLALVAGCGHVVDGAAQPAAVAVTLLPTEAELTDAVGNGLSTFDFRPFVGGTEIMPDGFRDDADASPFRCIGVTETMLRATYEGADVTEAARQSYFTLAEGAGVSGADAAAVRFGSAAAARDRYERFTEQWRGCDGQAVVKHLRGSTGTDVNAAITDVVAGDDLLTATVTTRQGANVPEQHYLRAVAIRDATVVEVSLAVARVDRTGPDAAAARAARVMLAKVG